MCVRIKGSKIVMYDRYELQQDLGHLYGWENPQFSKIYILAGTLFS